MPDADAEHTDDVGLPHIDTTKASIAQVYDAVLNGKDNYEIDREVVRQFSNVAARDESYGWIGIS
jgi:hypothetical protein